MAIDKDGLVTPETGTPPPRSVSPSSAGSNNDGPLNRIRAKEADTAPEVAPEVNGEGHLQESALQATDEKALAIPSEGALASSTGSDESALVGSGADAESATEAAEADRSEEEKKASHEAQKGIKLRSKVDDATQGKQASKQPKAPGARAASIPAPVTAVPSVGFNGFQMAMPREAMPTLPIGGQNPSFSDRRIIEVLAAPVDAHQRLLHTAKMVPEILKNGSEGIALSENVELYGSLSLDMTEPDGRAERAEGKQDWASFYINGRSDVDFVVELRPDTPPSLIAQRLMSKGHWIIKNETQVHKFASTQYTLHGSFDEDPNSTKVYLDITCIESPLHYSRFKQRQEAFRTVFTDVRYHMEAQFQSQGALAFDAYIHLLKAFAAKVPGNALTGFQATCIGIFTLQILHYRFKPNQSIALSLFEGFLRFCRYFFGEIQPNNPNLGWHYHHRMFGIDLSNGGRWLPRMSLCWRSELYFMSAEVKMSTRLDERVNVLHSLDPARVSAEAHALLSRAFGNNAQPGAWFGVPSSPVPAPVLPAPTGPVQAPVISSVV